MSIDSIKYHYGIGFPKNEKKAKEFCLKSESKGNKFAKAIKLYFGWETNKNVEKTIEILKEIVRENENTKNQKRNRFKEIEKQQLLFSLSLLAYIHKNGEEGKIEKDIFKAIELYEKAVEMCDPLSTFTLAFIYQKGEEGVLEKNILKAIQLYEKAVLLGNSNAMNNLALFYQNGEKEVLKKDPIKAIQLYEKSVEMGNSTAMNNLALLYQKGEEGLIEKNVLKAIKLFEKSVEMGNSTAIIKLALLYQKGEEGVLEKNILKAIKLFEKAVEMKNEEAFLHLAFIYQFGFEKRVEKDLSKSTLFLIKYFQKKGETTNFELLKLIKQNISTKKIDWKEEFHFVWDHSNFLNLQIKTILLISKHNGRSNMAFLTKNFSLKIIKFLCHFNQN